MSGAKLFDQTPPSERHACQVQREPFEPFEPFLHHPVCVRLPLLRCAGNLIFHGPQLRTAPHPWAAESFVFELNHWAALWVLEMLPHHAEGQGIEGLGSGQSVLLRVDLVGLPRSVPWTVATWGTAEEASPMANTVPAK